MQQKKVILLAGPTASGKSKLAVHLAQYINGEIINGDSMQIYKEISILTSRPDIKETSIVKHHLYGFYPVKKNFSTGRWLKMVMKKIKEQWHKNKTPIIVGGTGLYFKTLTDGLVEIPEIPNKLRAEIRRLHKKEGQKNFFKQLMRIDPSIANFISSNDSQRSIRAYEVKKYTNKSLFTFIKNTKVNFKKDVFRKIFINTPREILNKKIDQRVDEMFARGAISEVEKFLNMKIDKQLSSNKIIGIQEIRDHTAKKITLNKAKELIKLKTRQYAKRQFTWSRGHMKSWTMIYSPNFKDLFKKTIDKIF